MSLSIRVVIAQVDCLVGDVVGNAKKIIALSEQAEKQGANLVVFPELTLTGYPPEDLLWRPGLRQKVLQQIDILKTKLPESLYVVFGHPWWEEDCLYNAASVISEGEIVASYYKQELPNYSVFDERRYFDTGNDATVFECNGVAVGLSVCEDIWFNQPIELAKEAGAQIMVNLNASPFDVGKHAQREQIVAERSLATGLPVVYANLVGAQDELVFDGASFVSNGLGEIVCRLPAFKESLGSIDFRFDETRHCVINSDCGQYVYPDKVASVYGALVLGVRDYVHKNGFKGAVIGLSGGIDSALTLAVAVDALGADNIEAVMLPSRYTSDMSLEDAAKMATCLGVEYRVISIEQTFNAFLDTLSDEFSGMATDVTEENIQARCRGVILMAISNKKGKIVLTTGNKSEMAMGYSTLYGDMAGGFNVLKDVPKTLVYEVSRYCNREIEIIPARIIDRPPSAELRPDQTDQDSLPPYEVLDAILELYVEKDVSVDKIIEGGFDKETVCRVVRLLDVNEYKRRQAAPGVKITARAFGKDRRYPITSGYKELS